MKLLKNTQDHVVDENTEASIPKVAAFAFSLHSSCVIPNNDT